MNKEIAFFDFDGTITSKDTMLAFLRYLSGDMRYYGNMLLLSPVFAAMKMGMVSNHRAKEIMLSRFIGSMNEDQLKEACLRFSADVLPHIIRPKAMDCINSFLSRGVEVVVVSAAPEYWVRDWTFAHSLALISTRLVVRDGRLTGKILGRNCHGEEKVHRIREAFKLDDYAVVHAFGDTAADRPMLSLAHHSHYKPFR